MKARLKVMVVLCPVGVLAHCYCTMVVCYLELYVRSGSAAGGACGVMRSGIVLREERRESFLFTEK